MCCAQTLRLQPLASVSGSHEALRVAGTEVS